MSGPFGSQQWAYNAGGGSLYTYEIDQSIRCNRPDGAYVYRSPSSNGNRQTFTLSAWVKRADVSTGAFIFGAGTSGSQYMFLGFNNNGQLTTEEVTGSQVWLKRSTAIYRDVSAWYHVVMAVDTTDGTASNRVKLWVNNERITSFSSNTDPSQNTGTFWNGTSRQDVGGASAGNSSLRFDGFIAEVHNIDGTALDPTSFGESKNGAWVPKEYDTADGAYGTNGFYLKFADNSTASALGTDSSGQGNNFSVTNFSTNDKVLDSPTNSFATINNIYRGSNTNTSAYGLTSEGNLKFSYSSNSDAGTLCTHPFASGKYYWELRIVAGGGSSAYQHGTGIANVGAGYRKITNIMDGRDPNEIGMNSYTGQIRQGSSTVVNTLSTTGMANGSIIGCAVDADNGAIYWSYNGTFMNSSDPTSGASKTNAHATWTPTDGDMWVPTINASGGSVPVNVINFGQDSTFAGGTTAGGNSDENGYGDFKYAPPSGYLALSTANLDEPAIGPNSTTTSDEHFNTVLYTGTGATQSITGVGFQPDWTWIKARSAARSNVLYDSVRGVTKQLLSNSTNAEATAATGLTSFDSDGFSIGTSGAINTNSDTLVAWNWKAGGTAVSNTDGSITSSVSAAPDAGFSIVSYTGTGANATVGHGLSSAPDLVIVKNRSISSSWLVRHSSDNISNTPLLENTTSGIATNYWQTTQPTSSVFSVSSNSEVNGSGNNLIAYCFHDVDGFSKFGKYVGNGSADGTFIYTGFRPAFWMMKSISDATHWVIYDSARDPYNTVDLQLIANDTIAESNQSRPVDFLSNGVKLRFSSYLNDSGQTYIYLAFAESPFKYANAR